MIATAYSRYTGPRATLRHLAKWALIYVGAVVGAAVAFTVCFVTVGILRTYNLATEAFLFVLAPAGFIVACLFVRGHSAALFGVTIFSVYWLSRGLELDPKQFILGAYILVSIYIFWVLWNHALRRSDSEPQPAHRTLLGGVRWVMVNYKPYWILPAFFIVSIFCGLIVLTKTDVAAPFVYHPGDLFTHSITRPMNYLE